MCATLSYASAPPPLTPRTATRTRRVGTTTYLWDDPLFPMFSITKDTVNQGFQQVRLAPPRLQRCHAWPAPWMRPQSSTRTPLSAGNDGSLWRLRPQGVHQGRRRRLRLLDVHGLRLRRPLGARRLRRGVHERHLRLLLCIGSVGRRGPGSMAAARVGGTDDQPERYPRHPRVRRLVR